MTHRSFRQSVKNSVMNLPGLEKLVSRMRPRQRVFEEAYATQAWGSAESKSGIGSELGATQNIRAHLPRLFRTLQVKTFLDAPCGDWNWMRDVDLSGVTYIGADIVAHVIEENTRSYARPGVRFVHADLTRDDLPMADIILCRDCWIHLSYQDIAAMLWNFRRTEATWLLVSNTPSLEVNWNKPTGLTWRHLNLRRPPFSFPSAKESFKDHYADIPFEMTLWRLADLPPPAL